MGLVAQALDPAGLIATQPGVDHLAGHAERFGDLSDGEPVTQYT